MLKTKLSSHFGKTVAGLIPRRRHWVYIGALCFIVATAWAGTSGNNNTGVYRLASHNNTTTPGTKVVTIKLPPDISRFPPGPNVALVDDRCRDCHSADYTSSQPPLDRAGWDKVVTKMINVFGADDITSPEKDLILDYLVAVYGK